MKTKALATFTALVPLIYVRLWEKFKIGQQKRQPKNANFNIRLSGRIAKKIPSEYRIVRKLTIRRDSLSGVPLVCSLFAVKLRKKDERKVWDVQNPTTLFMESLEDAHFLKIIGRESIWLRYVILLPHRFYYLRSHFELTGSRQTENVFFYNGNVFLQIHLKVRKVEKNAKRHRIPRLKTPRNICALTPKDQFENVNFDQVKWPDLMNDPDTSCCISADVS